MISINLGTAVAYLYSFFYNKIFVFGAYDGQHIKKGSKLLVLQLALVLSTNSIMYLSVSILGFHYMLMIVILSVIKASPGHQRRVLEKASLGHPTTRQIVDVQN